MKIGILAAVITLVVNSASAQSILPATPDSTFPACALSCQPLLLAQTDCVPPTAPETDQYIYDQCFCQQNQIEGFYNSPDGSCDSSCTVESDRQLLQQWYKSFCGLVAATQVPTVNGGAPATSASTDATPTSTLLTSIVTPAGPTTFTNPTSSSSVVVVTITSTNTAQVLPTVTSTPNTGSASSSGNGSWIGKHWRWVLMIGVLIIGLGLLACLAVCLKRRHRRNVEKRRAAASGFPASEEKRGRPASSAALEDMFGPHQHQDMTKGWDYTTDQRKELGLAGLGAAIREKSRQRWQSRERRRERNRSQKGKSREDSTKAAELEATERSKSRRQRPPNPAAMDKRERSKSRKRAKRDIEKDPDAIEKG